MDNLNTITAYEQMRDMKAMHEKQLDELRDKNKELEAKIQAVLELARDAGRDTWGVEYLYVNSILEILGENCEGN